jgi:DNA-binding beta-propeller fold protein YncE
MNRLGILILACVVVGLPAGVKSQEKPPLELVQSIPLPDLHDGDFDHLIVDARGKRLFACAEVNGKVLVIDLATNKLIHTMDDLKAPHSILYRADLKKLFVADGDLGELKMYETTTYKPIGTLKLRMDADSMVYDPKTKLLYVVDGGKAANLPNVFLDIVDTTAAKKVGEIKLDSISAEAMAVEKAGPRMFADIRGNNTVEVYNLKTRALLATWPVAQESKNPTGMAFDEPNHRLFIGTREPGKLLVLDSDSGKIVASLPAVSAVDDVGYSSKQKRIYYAGSEFLDVFQQRDPDHYEQIGHIPTSFRAHTGVFSEELNRYYLGIPAHEGKGAEIRIYAAKP